MDAIRILILNYNGLDLLRECLPSMVEAAARSPLPARVSIVDNASTDGSRAWVAEAFPQVGWLQQPDNTVLYAYNRVLPAVEEDWVLLLNNDIRVEPNFIAPMLAAMQADPAAFAAAPRYVDWKGAYNGGMHRCGLRFSLAWAGPEYPGAEAESREPGLTLYNANGLFRRERLLAVGGFDRLYEPLGWEDTDLGVKAWERGWPTLYVPDSLIHHKTSVTIKRRFSEHVRRSLTFRNAALWLLSCAPVPVLLRALALLPPTLLLCALTGRWAQLHGLWLSLPRWPRAWRRRRRGVDRSWWGRFATQPPPLRPSR